MRLTFILGFLWAFTQMPLFSAPDFPNHGYTSTLPVSTEWLLKKENDIAEFDMLIRGFSDAEETKSIVLLMGRNNTRHHDLDSFTYYYFGRIKGIPLMQVISEESTFLGGIPAKRMITKLRLPSGQTHHSVYLVAISGSKLFTCTLSSYREPVIEDEDLMSYLNSIHIDCAPEQAKK